MYTNFSNNKIEHLAACTKNLIILMFTKMKIVNK